MLFYLKWAESGQPVLCPIDLGGLGQPSYYYLYIPDQGRFSLLARESLIWQKPLREATNKFFAFTFLGLYLFCSIFYLPVFG